MTGAAITIPTLQTERFTLRAPRRSDMEAYTAFRTSERARGVGGPYPAHETHDKLYAIVGHWLIEGFGRWVVADPKDNPLGIVGLMYPDSWPEPEIAWSVFADAEGKGVAFEAAQAARSYAYNILGWTTAVSCVMPDNTRSRALAQRLGARREADFDHPEYGILQVWRHPGPEALS